MRRGVEAWGAALPLVATLLTSCSSAPSDGEGVDGAVFIAFADDFSGYHGWQSYTTDGPAADSVHVAGPRTEYINHVPPHGSKTFPVGTIIVKEPHDLSAPGAQIFAMVKRGGDFNDTGAVGWEWFQIQNLADGSPDISWRGYSPPVGEMYGGDPNSSCNTCHSGAAKNDFVLSTKIVLADY